MTHKQEKKSVDGNRNISEMTQMIKLVCTELNSYFNIPYFQEGKAKLEHDGVKNGTY